MHNCLNDSYLYLQYKKIRIKGRAVREKKICFPIGDSNPGLLGESELS